MISKLIDHTLLKVDTSQADIIQLCEEALQYGTYSVCVNPMWVSLAKMRLLDSQVKVCTVIGFPLSATYESVALVEAELALMSGASELDVVLNVGALKSGDYYRVSTQLKTIVNAIRNVQMQDTVIKVIVESAVLNEREKKLAAEIVVASGADYLKTSTGFIPNPHLEDDVRFFKSVLPPDFKIKASGGIRDYQTARKLVDLGVERIGTSSTKQIIEQERVLGDS
ncbi:deoxyribose-phosphate aldolase [Alicyclobacillus acidoterrestris]|uniref:deoxyribose-phosphate aldolase n=1 Tax=Alicyclobacillus suci TaxID=2816080 RepID=UPI00119509C4|nr:deoxyribose-phosphate aldolase [Alicyclobacillus suci]GEO27541.1 deoxyribose-phosphate aldolase [Alicyclobacillus acidoterrestris]